MEIIIAVAAKIAEYTVAPVGRQLGYLFSYITNVQNLRKQLQDLKNAEERMKHDVNIAKNNCEEIYADVESWLSSVDEVSSEANMFLNHEDHAKAVCSCGSFPHLVTRHQLSRKAKKMSIHVSQVLQDRKFDQRRISYRPEYINLAQQESSSTIMKGFENFYSREEILKNVMAAMRDVGTRRIGLCGMGGIGKTMLAKEIARRAEEERLFSKVVLVPISQTPNLKEIQQHIADMLELRFGETDSSMGKRASLLQQRLKPDNKIMLILDDIWKELDLKEIGIHEECRMLLTSRNGQVLSNDMGIPENNIFEIEVLDPEEAINLFKIIGDIVENPDYKDLPLKIVGECGGLPICIATVAHALKCSKETSKWEDALKQLQSSNFTGIHRMDDKVYSSIRMSFDFLRSHEAKSLLLLCALHKEDTNISVEDLMKYSKGCRLIRGVNTVKEARNRVNTLVDDLKSRCLLLDGWRKGYVKMHDVIRDVCLSVAKEKEHRMNNITNVDMYEDFVKDETNKECKAISFLSYDDYNKLPQKLECPSLELVLLMSYWYSKLLPDDFFGQTTKLEALQMDCMDYILPSSFRSLQNLQTLCLRGTHLEDIAVIGGLQNLKVLDLSLSHSIKLLPKEIGQLWRLQLLDLRHCNNLEVIEPNVISNLTQMEELYLPIVFQGWETEESSMEEIRNVSLEEINSLQLLTVLYLSVPSANILPEGMFSGKLERYGVYIGNLYGDFHIDDEVLRWLYLNLSTMNEINAFGLKSLIKRSEYLSLKRLDFTNVDPYFDGKVSFSNLEYLTINSCDNLKYLFSFSIAQNFVRLKMIEVRECKTIKDIVVKAEEEEVQLERILFPKLEFLKLVGLSYLQRFCVSNSCMKFPLLSDLTIEDCPKLKTFVSSPTTDHKEVNRFVSTQSLFNEKVSFPNLEELTIDRCHNLKYLLSFSLGQQKFVKLKKIKVKDCKAMKDIGVKVGEEEIQMKMILFPKLESLELVRLSNLQRFCAIDSCMEFPLLSELNIQDCPKLKTFVSSPTLDHQQVNQLVSIQPFFNEKTAFPNLNELTIICCKNLKHLLSFVIAQSLVQLNTLKVWKCNNIEEVIVSDIESCGRNAIIFEKLQILELIYLPNLVKFYEEDYIECPLLSELKIWNVPKLKKFISNSMGKRACIDGKEMGMVAVPKQRFFINKVTSHNLKELAIDWSVIEEIFETKSSQSSSIFSNLFKLHVWYESKDKAIDISDVMSFLHKYHNIHTLELEGSFVDGHQQQAGHGDRLSDGDVEICELTKLVITCCSRLENIEWLPMSFHKLEILEIKGCDGLTCLFNMLTISTAGILSRLSKMKIINCSGMREVINTKYYDDKETEHCPSYLLFRLHTLELENLGNLKSFYSGNKDIVFPYLVQLSVKRCPQMMTFSNGNIETDAFLWMENWMGSVNRTVRKYWEGTSHVGLGRLFCHETDDDNHDYDYDYDDDDDDDDDHDYNYNYNDEDDDHDHEYDYNEETACGVIADGVELTSLTENI